MVERAGGAGLALESQEPAGVVREGGGKQFDGDLALEAGIARPVNLSHSAGGDMFNDLVGANAAPGLQVVGRLDTLGRGLFEETRGTRIVIEQRPDLSLEIRIVLAGAIEECGLAGRVEFQGGVQNGLNLPVTLGGHAVAALSSRCSQDLAMRQSRLTVAGEIPSTWAVSSILRPPK